MTVISSGTPASSPGVVRWLLLIHQVPAKPDYVRVKIRRRLRRLGAVALKNAVYVLPRADGTTEDLQWLLREITADGGDAQLAVATFVEGITDAALEAMFNADRDTEYAEIATAARELEAPSSTELARLRRRFEEVAAIDRFTAAGREAAEHALAALDARVRQSATPEAALARADERLERPSGRTWVTRAGVHVDRIASAWLIRRFIDPDARFKFVEGKPGYDPETGELRFDMFEGEYTHEGAQCTFETLLARFALDAPALVALGEIVHDIDLKESTFARAETAGVAAMINGIVATVADDATRIERGAALLDGLVAVLSVPRADA